MENMFCCLEEPEPDYPQYRQPYADSNSRMSVSKPYFPTSTRYSNSNSPSLPLQELEQRNHHMQMQINTQRQ